MAAPVYSIDLEQEVLGAVLADMELAYAAIIEPRLFYDPLHQKIANAFIRLMENTEYINPKTVYEAMRDDNDLAECGGLVYLEALKAAAPEPISFADDVAGMKHAIQRLSLYASKRGQSLN